VVGSILWSVAVYQSVFPVRTRLALTSGSDSGPSWMCRVLRSAGPASARPRIAS